MSRKPPSVVVLGAGPAGVGAAFWLTRRRQARVTILERQAVTGGNAGSFDLEGVRVDYGSHRLHPSCDLEILKDLRELLGAELLERRRHGRIRLLGQWIHFPLQPLDLALNLPRSFALRAGWDACRKPLRRRAQEVETFSSVLERGLGPTFCREFYFPYARKLWGLEPGQLSATQARRRVSAASPSKLLARLLGTLPGFRRPGAGRFFYPERGYGRISESLLEGARSEGARALFHAKVTAIECHAHSQTVFFERNDRLESMNADLVWSTLPITVAANAMRPPVPLAVKEAISSISYRGMILIYLVVEQDRFSEYDAHYFPAEEIPISRLSEPKNYSGLADPQGHTVLCAELPCDAGSGHWRMTDEELGNLVLESLEKAELPLPRRILRTVTRRLPQAYPVYALGYEDHLATVEDWLEQFEGLLTFGRQGLFAHDNTHHALFTALAAVRCLQRDGAFNRARWRSYRRIFETHVVED